MKRKKHSPVMEYVYKNGVVTVGMFTKPALEKYRKMGLLRFDPDDRKKYWITDKGYRWFELS